MLQGRRAEFHSIPKVHVHHPLCLLGRDMFKVAREGRDKIFTFSFWCIFRANNFFSSNFSGKGVGAMPYLLTNFWSRDSLYDGFFNI